jgi:hypothetical protein
MAGVKDQCAAEECDRGAGLLVRQHLGVGEPGGVVDGDVHVIPADRLAAAAIAVGDRAVVVLAQAVTHALSGAALDAPELLDVDVNELAGALALITLGRLEPEPAQTAHPDPGQDPRDRRDRHREQLGDLRASEPEPAQRGDCFDPLLAGAVGHDLGRAAAIQQSALSASPVSGQPLPTRS